MNEFPLIANGIRDENGAMGGDSFQCGRKSNDINRFESERAREYARICEGASGCQHSLSLNLLCFTFRNMMCVCGCK